MCSRSPSSAKALGPASSTPYLPKVEDQIRHRYMWHTYERWLPTRRHELMIPCFPAGRAVASCSAQSSRYQQTVGQDGPMGRGQTRRCVLSWPSARQQHHVSHRSSARLRIGGHEHAGEDHQRNWTSMPILQAATAIAVGFSRLLTSPCDCVQLSRPGVLTRAGCMLHRPLAPINSTIQTAALLLITRGSGHAAVRLRCASFLVCWLRLPAFAAISC